MLEILKTQPLIRNIDFLDENIMHFTLNGIPAKAMDYDHSICIGFVFIEKKMISDTAIHYISLMLVALEDTQDFSLQLKGRYWWLWCRCTIDDKSQGLSIKLEQLDDFIKILTSFATTMNAPKSRILDAQIIDANRVLP